MLTPEEILKLAEKFQDAEYPNLFDAIGFAKAVIEAHLMQGQEPVECYVDCPQCDGKGYDSTLNICSHCNNGLVTSFLFTAPPAQPDAAAIRDAALEPIPMDAIESILAEVMSVAVSNGANSISMPAEYVAVAHFVCCPEDYSIDETIRAMKSKQHEEKL